jgi:hypothetical protein
MRVRDWAVALSVAAVLGVGVGAVYSGVTGWERPSAPAVAGVVPDAGLPAPHEQAGAPAAATPSAGVGRSAPVRAAAEAASPSAKAKVKEPKAKPAAEKGRKHRNAGD